MKMPCQLESLDEESQASYDRLMLWVCSLFQNSMIKIFLHPDFTGTTRCSRICPGKSMQSPFSNGKSITSGIFAWYMPPVYSSDDESMMPITNVTSVSVCQPTQSPSSQNQRNLSSSKESAWKMTSRVRQYQNYLQLMWDPPRKREKSWFSSTSVRCKIFLRRDIHSQQKHKMSIQTRAFQRTQSYAHKQRRKKSKG